MTKIEVQWNPDERLLLDILHRRIQGSRPSKAKKDDALAATDTELMQEMQVDRDRYFAAKNRLVAAGALALYVDNDGNPLLQLVAPERKGSELSKRYVMTVIPLECWGAVRQVVEARRKRFTPGASGHSRRPGAPNARPQPLREHPTRKPDYAAAQKRGAQRLGVTPLPGQPRPLRPPMKAPAPVR